MRYGFVIDQQRCIGCHTCAVECRFANSVPEGTWWNRVLTEDGVFCDTCEGDINEVSLSYVTVACQHCENPACTKVCPVGATYKDPETGIVCQDYDKCIGCRMCVAACPYTGVRSFNWEEPKYTVGFPTGDADAAPHQKHVVEKCIMCRQRVAKGEEPACVRVCPARARFWGDLDDPESEVSQLLKKRSSRQLLAEEGTNPNVHFLV